MGMTKASSYASSGLLTEADIDILWNNIVACTNVEGVEVDGQFDLDKPIYVSDGYTKGTVRGASLKLLKDAQLYVATTWPVPSCHVSDLSLNANNRATHGLLLRNANQMEVSNVQVSNSTGSGFKLEKCQSAKMPAMGLRAHGCGTGFEVIGCNGLQAMQWSSINCATGFHISAELPVFQGDMSFIGMNVEGATGDAITIEDHENYPVHIGGRIRVEGGVTPRALVIKNSKVCMTGSVGLRATGDVIVVDDARLDLHCTMNGYCYSGGTPIIRLLNGGTVNGDTTGWNVITGA